MSTYKSKSARLLGLLSLLLVLVLGMSSCSSAKNVEGEERMADGIVTEKPKGYFRILVAGVDRASGLADVLMLISWNRDTEEAWILQIPRDTYAAYTKGSYRKLNGVIHALGGIEETRTLLEEALGLPIDRFMVVSLDALAQTVDALGGVEVELPQSMEYRDPAQGLVIHLPAGKQTLDGKEAEQLIRYRSGYARGDLDRLDTQKIFLAALLKKIKQTHSPATLIKLASALMKNTETDLTVGDVVLLAPELLRLETERVGFVTAPGADTVATVSGASYYVLSSVGMREVLEKYLGGEADAFDPREIFLNVKYPHFQKIYREKADYHPIHASALG